MNTRTIIILLTVLLSSAILNAKTFTYSQVHKMPTSVEKDYYIWRLLTQKITTAGEAKSIIQDASHLNKKLRDSYKAKTGLTAKLTSKPSLKKSDSRNDIDWNKKAKANKYFKAGIQMVKLKQLKQASTLMYSAHNNYEQRWEKDKCLFWLYLITEDKDYLRDLKKSYHINMYTLLAADITKSKYPRTIVTPRISKKSILGLDEKNPIHWAKIKSKIFKRGVDLDDLADDCKSKETIGMYCFIKAKACNFKKSYFPMPYRSIMKKYNKERQALIYAIARQESRFIPSSVSRSFALGMMQFMPFLVKHVAKQKKQHIDLDDMFKPKKAIEFADYHLDYLNKYLYHPLFVAYAYNAGIGFTRKLVRNKKYFRKGSFEPYLSMEKMKNVEAREYGKRVLTNYVVYLNKLGKATRLLPFIEILTDPSKTDKFR